jgi:hypothetical protein
MEFIQAFDPGTFTTNSIIILSSHFIQAFDPVFYTTNASII